MNNRICIICFFSCISLLLYGTPSSMRSETIQNWETQYVDSKIVLDIHKSGLHLPTDRNAALRLIEQNRSSLLKNMYLSILVDSSHQLGNYLAEEKIALSDINAIINQATSTVPVLSSTLDKVIVYHQTPLQQIANLFIKHNAPYTPSLFPLGTATKKYTGILIDARGQLPIHGEYTSEKLQPCLFPKIWDQNMNLIYEKNIVQPDTARKQSIVLYTSTLDETMYRDRIGTEPLRIIARGVFGDHKTDPIISNADAAKILVKQENLELLKEGKIVIVCDKDTLQVSPAFPLPDENFYFAYHDITKLILQELPDTVV
ncbi:MAG: OmpA family protein, partial [Treponema sp.]